jgi:hypothetical protein
MFVIMNKKVLKKEEAAPFTTEEYEVVDFFESLIPVLLEAKHDLNMELSLAAEKIRQHLVIPKAV